MLVIRIGRRDLTIFGMAVMLGLGLVLGSVRPAELVWASTRGVAPSAEVLPAPVLQPGARVTFEQATRMIQGGMEYGRDNGFRMSFVVLDAGGYVVASGRMDGAPFYTTEFARGKAYGTAATGRSSQALSEAYAANPALWGNAATVGYGAPLLPGRGALPIVMNGVLVGALGASGGPNLEDENAARAGLAAVGLE